MNNGLAPGINRIAIDPLKPSFLYAASILAWFADKKNLVEVALMDSKDKILVKHKVNGAVVAKGKILQAIDPGVNYHVRIQYDGSSLHLSVDGVALLELPTSQPTGGLGFRVKSTNGSNATLVVREVAAY